MALKNYKARSCGIRFRESATFEEITEKKPVKRLTKAVRKTAGRKRYLGIRPTVRGVAMNPVDHPMGGGEGRTSGGSHPRSPWGQLAKGGKTRAKRKASNKVIVKRRK